MRISPEERQKLVRDNVPFVRSIASKVREQLPRGIEFEDLVSYGMQGLLEAAERFDDGHGTSFTTFAYYRVRGAIFDGLRGMGWLPRSEYAKVRFEERAARYLQNLSDREIGAQEASGPPPSLEDGVRDLSEALGGVAAIFITTLEAAEIESPHATSVEPHREIEDRDEGRVVRDAVSTLPEKERRLLELYYFEDRSLAEAGEALGLSKSWSSRLHAKAVELLKAALERAGYTSGER